MCTSARLLDLLNEVDVKLQQQRMQEMIKISQLMVDEEVKRRNDELKALNVECEKKKNEISESVLSTKRMELATLNQQIRDSQEKLCKIKSEITYATSDTQLKDQLYICVFETYQNSGEPYRLCVIRAPDRSTASRYAYSKLAKHAYDKDPYNKGYSGAVCNFMPLDFIDSLDPYVSVADHIYQIN